MKDNGSPPWRLWPGVAAVALQWFLWLLLPLLVTGVVAGYASFLGAAALGVVVAVWWMFFSRAPVVERFGALLLIIAASVVTSQFLHESIAGGMMGMMFPMFSLPVWSLALVGWAVVARGLADGARRASLVATVVLVCLGWTLLRTEGIMGGGDAQLALRFTETPEERLLARGSDDVVPPSPTDEDAEADWPGFRGPSRDGVVPGVRIETDWTGSPPEELWRRPIGPGWSSFAVRGDLLYTQEQRGESEIVAAYRVSTGEPVWRHEDEARFYESNGGPGPRGTPTLRDGRVHTFGATGIVNVLDANEGTLVWSRNAAADTETKTPGWGFASSPLVLDELVIVAAAGQLIAYERSTGEPIWLGPEGGSGYSSPHLMTLGGVPQVLLVSSVGLTSVAPTDGTLLWQHLWNEGDRIVQPARISDGEVLLSLGGSVGVRRISVERGTKGWNVAERWTSIRLKPYFNDFVVHEGHAYGFDGRILACVDVGDGERKWKGGRYGHGQLVLLPDQDLLLVLAEEGDLVLVRATPDAFNEVARVPAIEGKTWNHPVIAKDVLLVRNGEEMAAFRLPMAAPELAARSRTAAR